MPQQPVPDPLLPTQAAPMPSRSGALMPLSSLPVDSALSLLDGWSPAEPLPRGLTTAAVSTAIGALCEAMAPASVEAQAVLLGMICAFGRVNRVDEAYLAEVMPMYREDLADLPAEVAVEAFVRVRRRWRFARALPLPGDIRAEAESIMAGWATARLRLETAARKLRLEGPTKPEAKGDPAMAARVREMAKGSARTMGGRHA